METYEILIVGAGAAGIAAAKAAESHGCRRILLVDRAREMGGVLLQCAHHGFGPDLTGPEYAQYLCKGLPNSVRWLPETTVLSVSPEKTAQLTGPKTGQLTVRFKKMILAAGCLEIPPGALNIAGTRPEGVYTAGQVQAMMNLYQEIPEGPVVILGGGDMGLLMAGALAEAGQEVSAVVEQRPRCGGTARNRKYLKIHQIPLLLNATITEILGEKQLSGVTVRFLKTGEETVLPCRTLLIAAGLRPDRDLVRALGAPDWMYLCGNCNRIHTAVEAVVLDGTHIGTEAAEAIRGAT